MRGEEDARRLQSSFGNTKRVYERQFGEGYGVDANDCENCGACTASCGIGTFGVRPTLPRLEAK